LVLVPDASLPAQIGQLGSLEYLYLDDNRLTGLPSEIGQLSRLLELYISDNPLSSLPAEICQRPDLYIEPTGLCGS
jgi:leucine-rich repeat protein SHOC2